MNKKLLHKTSRAYLVYSVVILLISAPVFYLATDKIYIKEADTTLGLHKKEFLKYTAPSLTANEIPVWNRFNRSAKIDSLKIITKDSLFYSSYYDTLDGETEPYRELNFPFEINGKKYNYSDRINLVEKEDLLLNIVYLFFSIICILLIGLYFITKKLSQNLWKPFYKTLKQIEGFEIDKAIEPTFLKTGIEEFERLNASILNLIKKNTSIYNSQKEFIENAAHELQTPLAVFQAKIDTLIQRNDVTDGQSEILGSLNENVSRLNRLNKNLLLLSKIEHDAYSGKQALSLNNLLNKNIDFFREQATSKCLTIHIALQQDVEVLSNPVLAEIFVSNLFLNAIKHNIEGGNITIEVIENRLIFTNNGKQMSLSTNTLFNRFSKGNPSEQGTGLGLSLIKKIADINKWVVSYHFNDDQHRFSIQF